LSTGSVSRRLRKRDSPAKSTPGIFLPGLSNTVCRKPVWRSETLTRLRTVSTMLPTVKFFPSIRLRPSCTGTYFHPNRLPDMCASVFLLSPRAHPFGAASPGACGERVLYVWLGRLPGGRDRRNG